MAQSITPPSKGCGEPGEHEETAHGAEHVAGYNGLAAPLTDGVALGKFPSPSVPQSVHL